MNTPHLGILVALILSLLGAGIFLWQMLRVRSKSAAQTAGRRASGRRRGDVSKMTRPEKRVFQQARHFLKKGKVQTAAKLFESIGFVREALAALEAQGLVDEAAKLLIKGRSYHRAAVLYSRYGMWTKAKESYRIANMPLEAAKAAREAGELHIAVELFEKATRLDLAAETCVSMGNLHRAARLYATAGNREEAIKLYRQMSDATAHQAGLNLEDGEIKIIIDYVTSGHHEKIFTDLLVKKNKLVEVILHLLTEARLDEAGELYTRANAEIGPALIAEVSFASQASERLGEMFSRVKHHQLAAELFERMGSYERAGQYFERADDPTRAASCYAKAGMGSGAARQHWAEGIGINEEDLLADSLSKRNDVARLMGPYEVGIASESPLNSPPEPGLHLSSDAVMMDELRSIFYKLPLFDDLEFGQRSSLWEVSTIREFEKGQVLLDFGKEAAGLYIVMKGQVACLRRVSGKEHKVDQIGAQECFGELWLLTEMLTGVKFVALSPVVLRLIPRSRFLELLDKDGTLARKLYKTFTKSLLKRLLSPRNDRENKIAS